MTKHGESRNKVYLSVLNWFQHNREPPSKADIARKTELSWNAVDFHVRNLVQEGLLEFENRRIWISR